MIHLSGLVVILLVALLKLRSHKIVWLIFFTTEYVNFYKYFKKVVLANLSDEVISRQPLPEYTRDGESCYDERREYNNHHVEVGLPLKMKFEANLEENSLKVNRFRKIKIWVKDLRSPNLLDGSH